MRVLKDSRLNFFFGEANLFLLKHHQTMFLKAVFTQNIAPDADVTGYMLRAHRRLFERLNLNETHFDMVVEHLVSALSKAGAQKKHIQELQAYIGPLRTAFETEARKYGNSAPGGHSMTAALQAVFQAPTTTDHDGEEASSSEEGDRDSESDDESVYTSEVLQMEKSLNDSSAFQKSIGSSMASNISSQPPPVAYCSDADSEDHVETGQEPQDLWFL